MPIYCYKLPSGEIIEQMHKMGAAPQKVRVKGKGVAIRDFQSEHVSGQMVRTENPVAQSAKPGRPWPMTCYASGVHPEQAGELRKHLANHGCPTEISKGGDPVYTSAAHRKCALKCRGLHDNASFS